MVRKRRLGRTGLEVSEISLGTVELGMAYGIGGASKPTEREAAALLGEALDLGVNLLDTARAYGDAEEIIGRHLGHRRAEYVLVSKALAGTRTAVIASVEESLRALRTDYIDIMLIHCGHGAEPDGETVSALQTCQAAGKVRFVGASVYGEAAALASIGHDWCACVEIATSALDRRPEARTLPLARERDTGVLARSVLLKGALGPRSAALPPAFRPLRAEVDRLCAVSGVDLAGLPAVAYRYVANLAGIGSALVGTAQASELKAAMAAVAQGPLEVAVVEQIRSLPLLSEAWLNPGQWPPE